MRRLSILLALAFVCLAALPAAAQTVVRHLELEERLTGRQIESLRSRYQAARAREVAARGRVDELAGELDRRLTAEGAAVDDLEELERGLAEARGRAGAAAEEAVGLRRQLLELLRRRELIRTELGRTRGAPADLPDPVTGAWNLELRPGDHRGLLDLTLDGTRVSGTLGLDDGSFGSVRGTFTAGRLELERVSAEGGLDMALDGRLAPASGTFEGTWRPLVLGRGEPPGGTWRAVPAEASEAAEPPGGGTGGER